MIQVRGLVKNYGLNAALRGVDLHVPPGKFVALVGPNGAGKSTLLRIVATLLRPSEGEVKVGGWLFPHHAARVRRHIGLVSHQPLLYRDLSAAENLEFFARLYQLDEVQGRVEEALRKVGLFARQRDPVGGFSRGMVQRLTIARATLHEPDVLLLDEPYTGLDQDASQLLDWMGSGPCGCWSSGKRSPDASVATGVAILLGSTQRDASWKTGFFSSSSSQSFLLK